LDAAAVETTASDFLLDCPARHKGGPGFRRALVHDFNDGLTINFAGDYPGGVTINGPSTELSTARIGLDRSGSAFGNNDLDQVTLHATLINLDTLRSDSNAAGDVKFTFEHPGEVDQDGNQHTPDFPETVFLGALLTTLRDEISLLKDRVAKLESSK
jgi:hypothetical protein